MCLKTGPEKVNTQGKTNICCKNTSFITIITTNLELLGKKTGV
jgi:hypothetical protein